MSYIATQMARTRGPAGPINDGLDKAVTIRPSSTANFFVDSLDKTNGISSAFVINKSQSLFNGFFHRIAVNEVVMDWGLPNIAAWWRNNTITVVNGGTGYTIGPVTLVDGFYTAIQALQAVASAVNTAAIAGGDPLRLSVQFDGLDVKLVSTGVGTDVFYVVWVDGTDPAYSLARQLFTTAQLAGAVVQDTQLVCASPRILGTTYVDFVSPQLTYNQDLKDNTTSLIARDALYRWYLADDNVPLEREPILTAAAAITSPVTAPGLQYLAPTNLPVLQGYTPFSKRRALPVPKQILWDSTAPIGQVAFEVYDDRGRLIDTRNFPWNSATGYGGANFQFQMSLLLSEN
jgi:hypothetical protein